MSRPGIRVYPIACQSAYCGKGPESCPTCPYEPAKLVFEAWQKRTAAVCTDPIWCSTVYQATRPDPEER